MSNFQNNAEVKAAFIAQKLFRAYWSPDAFDPKACGYREVEVCAISQFCEGNGYTAEDIAAIDALSLGETWEDGDYGDRHTITRIR